MTKHFVLYSDSSHKHILTWHTENDNFQVKQVIQTSFPKRVTFKNRKKSQRIMNFSLHLRTIFTFIRQNKATSEEKKTNPYTYTRTVLDVCLLCTWTQRLWICFGWKVYWKQSMHIYIYTYIKGREVVRCCKHLLFAFSRGYNYSLLSNIRSQCFHFSSPVTASLQLSFWLLFLGWYTDWVGKINAWIKACIRVPLLYPFILLSHWDNVVRRWVSEWTHESC